MNNGKLLALILGVLAAATSFADRTANQGWVRENFVSRTNEWKLAERRHALFILDLNAENGGKWRSFELKASTNNFERIGGIANMCFWGCSDEADGYSDGTVPLSRIRGQDKMRLFWLTKRLGGDGRAWTKIPTALELTGANPKCIAVLARTECLSERVKGDILAVCDYDAESKGLGLTSKEAGYIGYALQAACNGTLSAAVARSAILNAAIAPARRKVRAESGTFVGEEGAKKVKEVLDGLAAELNAPRFGKAGEILAGLGMDLEWEFVQSRILGDAEVAGIRTLLMDGEIPFGTSLQNKLCVALGVEAYNAFVTEYNGK